MDYPYVLEMQVFETWSTYLYIEHSSFCLFEYYVLFL